MTMVTVLSWTASALILAGALFSLVGALGVLRLPDCYTRMHAAGKAGALGAALILAGVATALRSPLSWEALFAMILLLATAPLAAHLIARAAYRAGFRPRLGGGEPPPSPAPPHGPPARGLGAAEEAESVEEPLDRQTPAEQPPVGVKRSPGEETSR